MPQNNSELIAAQNDRFRGGDEEIPGQIVITNGLAAHMQDQGQEMLALYEAVQQFSDFTEENDPHQEHDFGAFEFAGERCFWKIDLYNPTLDGGSEDPTDLSQTKRVLTIMLTHEY